MPENPRVRTTMYYFEESPLDPDTLRHTLRVHEVISSQNERHPYGDSYAEQKGYVVLACNYELDGNPIPFEELERVYGKSRARTLVGACTAQPSE